MSDRFYVGHPLVLHQEGECIAPFAAAEVLENTFSGHNKKGRSLFVGKRAQRPIILSRLFQCDKIADHIDNIDPVFDLFNGIA